MALLIIAALHIAQGNNAIIERLIINKSLIINQFRQKRVQMRKVLGELRIRFGRSDGDLWGRWVRLCFVQIHREGQNSH